MSLFVFFVYLFTDISADEERDKSLAYIVRNEIFTLFDLIWPQFLCKFVGTAADTVQQNRHLYSTLVFLKG